MTNLIPVTWWQWTIAVWVLAYFPMMAALLLGLRRLPRSQRLPDASCDAITVTVSARNEERDLPACIASLVALDYPPAKLQIILVDDHSTDSTGEIIDAAAKAHTNITALHSASLPPNGLEAKGRGIANGFAHATGDWVFITDADASVHPQWLRHMLGRATEKTGMVGGTVVVDAIGAIGTVERVSWAYTQLFSLAASGWNVPFVCVGPNMAIRRSAYVEAGGLERAEFRVSEDVALFTMVASRHMEVQSYADEQTAATLRPVPSARHLVSQQRRWFGGGLSQGLAYSLPLLASFWWGFGVVLYVLLGWTLSVTWWLAFIGAKAIVDAVALAMQQRRLNLEHHVRYLWVIELYHLFVFLVLPPSFLFSRKIRWMGDGYTVTYP